MRRFSAFLLAAATPLLVTSGCLSHAGNAATPQGWDEPARDAWYVGDQGSRLIPKAWIDALEQPGGGTTSGGKFTEPAYLAQFHYIAADVYPRRDATPFWERLLGRACPIDQTLPLGFVTDCQTSDRFGVTNLTWRSNQSAREPWVGMNCSACHTNAVEFHYPGGTTETKLIDGAPTLADFQGFMAQLELALEQTHDDPQKFARFAAAVLPPDQADADRPKLAAAMQKLIGWNKNLARLNADGNPGTVPYGYGRLDAIGHIFNKVALAALPGDTQTSRPSDAPVSYPFLWNVPQLDHVEWDGVAPSIKVTVLGTEDFGALARNTGEVTGVFADITITPNAGAKGYVSSARIDRLDEMEQQLRSLQAPAWPAQFPLNQTNDPKDPAYARSVARGRTLFEAQKCEKCHTGSKLPFGDTTDPLVTALTPLPDLGTDMWMACNASFDTAQAGAFTGEPLNLVAGDPTPAKASNLSLLQTAAVGTLLGQKATLVDSVVKGILGLDNGLPQPSRSLALRAVGARDVRINECLGAMHDPHDKHFPQLVYKGRPLQGIWATAPYLHNGSVPSLYTLLLPQEKRPTKFCVGSRVFDPKEVGFLYQPNPQGDPCPGASDFDVLPSNGQSDCQDVNGRAVVCGNSNWGHDYNNAALSEDDRYALIEFMKTL